MKNDKPTLRFDHREIAVIFSLFVFVSLLMFTVGILVGKGLTLAKFSGRTLANTEHSSPHSPPHASLDNSSSSVTHGTSVGTTAHQIDAYPEENGRGLIAEEGPYGDPKLAAQMGHASAGGEPRMEAPEQPSHLKLTPKNENALHANSLLEPDEQDSKTDEILNDPKIQALLEDSPTPKVQREVASLKPHLSLSKPSSFSSGPYTVQIGSYPNKNDAAHRVESLKAQDFPYAFFSAKEVDGKLWYRVWLGYFENIESAKSNADILKARGEVRDYLVRKSSDSKS